MRSILFLSLVLVGACAARDPRPEPVAGFAYSDLALETAEGRGVLRARVDAAAQAYCRDHADEVTPQLIRTQSSYCLDTLRQSLVEEMPGAVRKAYWQR